MENYKNLPRLIDLLIDPLYIKFKVISNPDPYEGLSSVASGKRR